MRLDQLRPLNSFSCESVLLRVVSKDKMFKRVTARSSLTTAAAELRMLLLLILLLICCC